MPHEMPPNLQQKRLRLRQHYQKPTRSGYTGESPCFRTGPPNGAGSLQLPLHLWAPWIHDWSLVSSILENEIEQDLPSFPDVHLPCQLDPRTTPQQPLFLLCCGSCFCITYFLNLSWSGIVISVKHPASTLDLFNTISRELCQDTMFFYYKEE